MQANKIKRIIRGELNTAILSEGIYKQGQCELCPPALSKRFTVLCLVPLTFFETHAAIIYSFYKGQERNISSPSFQAKTAQGQRLSDYILAMDLTHEDSMWISRISTVSGPYMPQSQFHWPEFT